MTTATAGPSAAGQVPALEVDHVSASYGPYRALFDVSFSVPGRGVTALIGSNGAGKSTVSRVVTGLVPSTSGVIRLSGKDITGMPAYRIARAGTAHVPEGRGVFASLTVEENLRLVFRQRGGRQCMPDALARAYEAFPVLGRRRTQHGGTLSGGEQRMRSLAKVLVLPPGLLVNLRHQYQHPRIFRRLLQHFLQVGQRLFGISAPQKGRPEFEEVAAGLLYIVPGKREGRRPRDGEIGLDLLLRWQFRVDLNRVTGIVHQKGHRRNQRRAPVE